jgi:L-alanine-DL-glutamate epimerase-like enolase superfamily enzyme
MPQLRRSDIWLDLLARICSSNFRRDDIDRICCSYGASRYFSPLARKIELLRSCTKWEPSIDHYDSCAAVLTIAKLTESVYTVPTDLPEGDGTLDWNSTTLVLVQAIGGSETGIGYTYADTATARLIEDKLRPLIEGGDIGNIPGLWKQMTIHTRNLGHAGIVAMAISAVDTALWDLKARFLRVPLCELLGTARDSIPLYGSGGFTTYSIDQLQQQLAGWATSGMRWVKMKVGREPGTDLARVGAARKAIGSQARLFVDANGAYSRKQSLELAQRFADLDVTWFEEPVSSDDLEGLRLIRDKAPAGMEIAAGEYGYDLIYFRRLIEAGAVDVLQADITRCGGITGFMGAGILAESSGLPLSSHCAPLLHLHPACSINVFRHAEYFHDHVRIEHLFFDGVPTPEKGRLKPDLTRPGLGVIFKEKDASKYQQRF